MRTRPFITICLVAGLMALAACHDKPTQQVAAQDVPRIHPGEQGASPGKPLPPIMINYHVAKDIQVAIPFVISIDVTPMVDAQQILLRYRTTPGIDSSDPQQNFTFGATAANTTLHQDITVTAQSEGRYRVILTVIIASQHGHGGGRSISIPLVVGNPPAAVLKPEGKISKDVQGHEIEVTPAQEEIIRH